MYLCRFAYGGYVPIIHSCHDFVSLTVDLIVKDLTSSLMVLRYVGSSPHLILFQPDIFHFIGFVPYISRDNERFLAA